MNTEVPKAKEVQIAKYLYNFQREPGIWVFLLMFYRQQADVLCFTPQAAAGWRPHGRHFAEYCEFYSHDNVIKLAWSILEDSAKLTRRQILKGAAKPNTNKPFLFFRVIIY